MKDFDCTIWLQRFQPWFCTKLLKIHVSLSYIYLPIQYASDSAPRLGYGTWYLLFAKIGHRRTTIHEKHYTGSGLNQCQIQFCTDLYSHSATVDQRTLDHLATMMNFQSDSTKINICIWKYHDFLYIHFPTIVQHTRKRLNCSQIFTKMAYIIVLLSEEVSSHNHTPILTG